MKVYRRYKNLPVIKPVATIGTFDGVHTGHRYVLNILKTRAQEMNGEPLVITFEPHPGKVISGDGFAARLLTTTEEKISLIEELGIDHVVILKFSRSLSRMNSEQFLAKILSEGIGIRHLLIGFNHSFGHMGSFDYQAVRKTAASYNITSEILDAVKTGGSVISSTRIREALAGGEPEIANRMLGYCYFIEGNVVKGRGIGRRLGYPTANIKPYSADKLIPADGVYAVEAVVQGRTLPAVMSIGFNPTIYPAGTQRSIEVHIPGFSQEIYGEKVKVIIKYRLRGEMIFGSHDELARKIKDDIREAIRLLSNR